MGSNGDSMEVMWDTALMGSIRKYHLGMILWPINMEILGMVYGIGFTTLMEIHHKFTEGC